MAAQFAHVSNLAIRYFNYYYDYGAALWLILDDNDDNDGDEGG